MHEGSVRPRLWKAMVSGLVTFSLIIVHTFAGVELDDLKAQRSLFQGIVLLCDTDGTLREDLHDERCDERVRSDCKWCLF